MWIIKWVLGVFFILLFLLFALQNQEQTVSVRFLDRTTPNMPLYLIIYVAFAVGILLAVLASIFNILRLKNQIHRLQRESKKNKEELNRLRNASIEDELETTESDQDDNLERKALTRKKR